MPEEASLTRQGQDWLRFRTRQPAQANPAILRTLLDKGLPVLSLHEVPRSLEEVYLQAVNSVENEEAAHA
jgi:ABC-2 type transport system ATP-binding protein